MQNKLIMLLLVGFLTACGTTSQVNTNLLDKPIPKNEARIIVERDNSLLYLAAAVDVTLNGENVASLGRGGSVVHDVRKGKNIVSVSTPTAFGRFTLRFDAKAGETYNFVVRPNSEALLVGSAFGMIGDAVNAEISENSGYFEIELQELEKEIKK